MDYVRTSPGICIQSVKLQSKYVCLLKYKSPHWLSYEVELPNYWQSASCYHALLDDEYALEINIDNPSIKRVYISTATVCGVEEISEEVFNFALNQTKNFLNLWAYLLFKTYTKTTL